MSTTRYVITLIVIWGSFLVLVLLLGTIALSTGIIPWNDQLLDLCFFVSIWLVVVYSKYTQNGQTKPGGNP